MKFQAPLASQSRPREYVEKRNQELPGEVHRTSFFLHESAMQAASLAATQFGSQNSQIYLGMKFVIVVLSRAQLFATPRTEARWGPLSRGLSRREY